MQKHIDVWQGKYWDTANIMPFMDENNDRKNLERGDVLLRLLNIDRVIRKNMRNLTMFLEKDHGKKEEKNVT